jgi:predicted DNA-binding protein
MAAQSARNFHVPISEDIHRRLKLESARTKRPATALAREAIEAWLGERRRRALRSAIAEYAEREAGGPADLDEQLERAAVDHLRRVRRRR